MKDNVWLVFVTVRTIQRIILTWAGVPRTGVPVVPTKILSKPILNPKRFRVQDGGSFILFNLTPV